MRIYDLKQKEVINTCNCRRLGCVADVVIDPECGKILFIIIPGPCKVWGLLGRDSEYIIPWKCICQIGPDIILVQIEEDKFLKKCE